MAGSYADGVGWVAQFPEVCMYAILWHALFWVCYFAAPVLFVSVASLNEKKGEHGYWAASMTSTIHAILIFFLAVVALYQDTSLVTSDDFFVSTPLSLLTCRIFTGYTLADLCVSLYFNARWGGWIPNVCHHVCTFIAWYGMGAGSYAQGCSLLLIMCEITTPFVNQRWFFDKSGMKGGKVFVINGVLMLVFWFIFRIVGYFSVGFRIYAQRQGLITIPTVEMILFLFCYVAGAGLMVLWFQKIVAGALKTVRGAKARTA